MTDLAALSDEAAAKHISEQLSEFDKQHERRYASLGLMADECERRMLWRLVLDNEGQPCRSFGHWLLTVCPHAKSTVYAALADVKALSDLPAESIAQIRESNFDTMKFLSTAVRRDPEVLRAASESSNTGFVAFVQENHPGQAIERLKPLKLTFTASQRAVVDAAVKKAIERGDATSATQWVEMQAASYLDDCRMDEACQSVGSAVIQ